jgi:hypothetical protein
VESVIYLRSAGQAGGMALDNPQPTSLAPTLRDATIASELREI